MIRNFKSKAAQDVYDGIMSRYAKTIPIDLYNKVRRLFDQINATSNIETLRVPPSNNLEKLKGNLQGYWSIRVNKKWRIIFRWENNVASDVDIIDYH